jgi:hypothetical protein
MLAIDSHNTLTVQRYVGSDSNLSRSLQKSYLQSFWIEEVADGHAGGVPVSCLDINMN